MKKIILHIGANKTGSTSIQNVFSNNESKLNKNSILYPKTGSIWNGHFKLAWSVGAGKGPIEVNKNIWKELKEEIENSEAQTTVISSENFLLVKSHEQIKIIKETFSNYDVKVILFIRRQDYWLESLYLQRIKMGFLEKNLYEFRDKPGQQLDFQKILDPWIKTFGQNSINLINFEELTEDNGAIKSFLKSINHSKLELEEKRDNDSIDKYIAQFILSKPNIFKERAVREKIIKIYNEKIKKEIKLNLPKNMLTKDERLDILKKYSESNKFIANYYFKRELLFDTEIIPDGNEKISNEQLHELVNKIILELIDGYNF